METSLKTGFAQISSRCPKNLSCPNFGGAAAPLAPPARTPMFITFSDRSFDNTVYVQTTLFNSVLSGYSAYCKYFSSGHHYKQ